MAQGYLRVACISDTHDVFYPQIPDVDAIIHAGDISLSGNRSETLRFLRWYEALAIKHKLFIGGNHDRFLEGYAGAILQNYPSVRMLWNSSYDLEGYKVWGSPVSPAFGHIQAFAKERESPELKHVWEQIPKDTDILVTHGPQWGILDTVEGRDIAYDLRKQRTYATEHLGDKVLRDAVKSIAPAYHICGHIHGSHGFDDYGTFCVNASVIDENYRPWTGARSEVIVLELPRREEPESSSEENSKRVQGL